MEKQLKLFFEFLENDKKLSNNTLQSYKRDLKQFRRYIEGCEVAYNKVDEEVMHNYIEYLEELGKKPSTISRCIASIRSIFLCVHVSLQILHTFFVPLSFVYYILHLKINVLMLLLLISLKI